MEAKKNTDSHAPNDVKIGKLKARIGMRFIKLSWLEFGKIYEFHMSTNNYSSKQSIEKFVTEAIKR